MGGILGYARVSTGDQDVAGQTMRLEKAGAIKVFTDVMSGKSMDRPGLADLLAYARKGDTLAVVRLDRLGRSLAELLVTVEKLHAQGVALLSLEGLSALLGHGYTVDNRAQPEMATFGVFRRRVPPIAMQNRRLPLDHWGQVVVRSDFR